MRRDVSINGVVLTTPPPPFPLLSILYYLVLYIIALIAKDMGVWSLPTS